MSYEQHYVGTGRAPFFPPTGVGEFRHNVPDGASFAVYDRNKVAICGRIVPGSKEKWRIDAPDWECRFDKRAVRYSEKMCFRSVNYWRSE